MIPDMKKILIILMLTVPVGLWLILVKRPLEKKTSLVTPSELNPETKSPVIVAKNLDTPWAIAFLPDGNILVSQRFGEVSLIKKDSSDPVPVAKLPQVQEIGEGGLLGIALHPDFSSNNLVYLYYTFFSSANETLNRVSQLTYQNNQLTNEQVIVDNIPGSVNHNGGRIKFGPDNYLYITTGDAGNPSLAQDINSLAGKILRVTPQGTPAPGNPFNNLVFSYGHRNPQGLSWDASGKLWSTEHGQSGLDEFNLIEIGNNYGWPVIRGLEKRDKMVTPNLNSGNLTWAPAGMAYFEGSVFFGGLRGQSLYRASINPGGIDLKDYFKNQYGRIREVILGPDTMLYITTSNKDGRGSPQVGDDKIIRIDPRKL